MVASDTPAVPRQHFFLLIFNLKLTDIHRERLLWFFFLYGSDCRFQFGFGFEFFFISEQQIIISFYKR